MNQTHHKNRFIATAMLLLSGLAANATQADTLTLSDGSVLNGQIIRISGGEITLSTAFAGEITVKQDQVLEIATIEPVFVQSGPSTVFGTVSSSVDGLRIRDEGTEMNIPVAAVEAVWRPGEMSPQEKALARRWEYTVNVGLSGSSGNTDRFSLLGQGRATMIGPDDRLTFYGSYDRAENDGELTADEIKGGVDYARDISAKMGWYVRTELERDDAENLDLRSTAAAGASYLWQDTDEWRLEVRGGLAYRYESFNDGSTNDVPGLDFVLLNTYTLGDAGRFKTVITYNPAFEDFGNFRLFHETVYEVPIAGGERWRVQVGLSNDYSSRPNGDLKKMDTTYFTRFLLEWR